MGTVCGILLALLVAIIYILIGPYEHKDIQGGRYEGR